MRNLIYVVLFSLPNIGHIAAQQVTDDLVVYEQTIGLGEQLFFELFKLDGTAVRTAAILEACGHDGLARAVEAKEKNFTTELAVMMGQGRFNNLPKSAVLATRAVGVGMRTGYEKGFQEAVKLGLKVPGYKDAVCAVAVKSANDILK